MPPSPTSSDAPEQRSLAAIVFTDVAGFSRRVQVEESDTLRLLERDFVTMRAFAAMHSGRVIKSTGDGLLLFFTSAVHAVEWSLRTQRHFADQAALLPSDEVLRHRVGVHLGDVFVGAGDVMGDGVNIAARVMTEAQPGSICISQVVYGVVKNKLKLDVVRLEPRPLKNISEVVVIYRVLLEPPVQKTAPMVPPRVETPVAGRTVTSPSTKWVVIATAVLLIGAAAALLLEAHREHRRELAESQEVRDALGTAMRLGSGAAAPATEPASTDGIARATAVDTPGSTAAQFDFAKLTANRPPGAPTTAADQQILEAANQCHLVLTRWTPTALQRYTQDRPLPVSPLRPGLQRFVLFTDSNRQLHFSLGGAIRKQEWQELKPEVVGAIVVSLLRASPAAPPREVVRGAEAFAYVHRLPEMAEELLRERKAR